MENMKSMECPFTWGFDDVAVPAAEYKSHDDEETLPLLQLMRKLMNLYSESKNIKTAYEEDEDVLVKLTECESLLLAFQDSDGEKDVSHDVVQHIMNGTRAFVLSKLHMMAEMEKVLSNVKNIDILDKIAKSTLLGCKGICWAIYARGNADKAEKFIRGAINENSDYHLWHFILGKILRNTRRDLDFGSLPSREEECSFKIAYSLFKNPFYGIFLGQMYREKNCHKEACEIYKQIFQTKPESTVILLRLALGFMKFKEMEKAKQCLDKVSESSQKSSMFSHYQGIYYLKMQQYWTAAKYFQDAAKDNNLGADYQYIECMIKVDKHFNVTQHLLKMIEKYRHLPEKQLQQIFLDLAVLYWKNENKIEDALKYFQRALKIDSKSKVLMSYNPFQIGLKLRERNIFNLMEKEFLPVVYRKYSSNDILKIANEVEEICNEHHATRYKSTKKGFNSLKLH